MISNAFKLQIVSGEGTGCGHVEDYVGTRTAYSILSRLTRERCGGDRWAYLLVDGMVADEVSIRHLEAFSSQYTSAVADIRSSLEAIEAGVSASARHPRWDAVGTLNHVREMLDEVCRTFRSAGWSA